jgi:uncharacterized membrane protein
MATKSQAEVLKILNDMRLKKWVTISILIAFFIVLIVLILMIVGIFKTDWQTKAVVGALDAILGGTMYPLVNHFFPSQRNAAAAESRDSDSRTS